MKVLSFFAYIGLGIAFLAVSFWLFLSGGRSAKAVRAKFKLGGLMLSTWAIVSAASCNGPGPGPMVTCYEPAQPPEVLCYDVAMEIDALGLNTNTLTRGETVELKLSNTTFASYLLQLMTSDKQKVLQEVKFIVPEEHKDEVKFSFTPASNLPEGEVLLVFSGIYRNEGSDADQLRQIASRTVTIK